MVNSPNTNLHPPIVSNRTNWIRGVNLGGWLVLERYIAPYSFSITDCHLRGDYCWYPGALGAPPSAESCLDRLDECQPYLRPNVYGDMDYPYDEYDLGSAFADKRVGAQWLDYHFDNFLQKSDLIKLKAANITYLRVPLPHWILGDVQEDEPWIVGARWKYFLRLLEWCNELDLQVWPDIHTAPGSQNGFDNSGHQLTAVSCLGWSGNPEHVQRSLDVIRKLTSAIADLPHKHVVTGFGLLNEPFRDCPRNVYLDFINQGLDIVHANLGPDTHVYVSDLFAAMSFNDGHWWLDDQKYSKTYLDSHYYHVFSEHARNLSPRQHVAFTCQAEYHARTADSGSASCCFVDAPVNRVPSPGVARLVGEWSAAVDTLPVAKLDTIMEHIATHHEALEMNRTISPARQEFLRNFVQAQMVSYEAADVGVGAGWFYWTLKMEGGAFAEWDFLRGVEEGWIEVPASDTPSQAVFGSCYEIVLQTSDDPTILQEFPPPTDDDADNWQGVTLDDDVVVSHGDSLLHGGGGRKRYQPPQPEGPNVMVWVVLGAFVIAIVFVVRRFQRGRSGYEQIQNTEIKGIAV